MKKKKIAKGREGKVFGDGLEGVGVWEREGGGGCQGF